MMERENNIFGTFLLKGDVNVKSRDNCGYIWVQGYRLEL